MSLLVYRQFINRNLPLLERGCTSKAMFISRREAVSATRRGHRGDGALHPYHCGNCAGWHLGHRSGRLRRPASQVAVASSRKASAAP